MCNLTRILPEIKKNGCRAIELTGGGEPTLYSRFDDLILFASEIGFRMCLITNGSMLNKYSRAILDSNIDWIRVSLDACSQNTHSKIHSLDINIFDKIVNTISAISPQKTIGISYIISKDNYKEIYLAAKLAKDIGAAYIEFKPMIDESKAFKKYDYYREFIISEIQKSSSLEDNTFSVVITQSLNNLLCTEDISLSVDKKNYPLCYSCYLRTILTPSGIYPCSYYRETEYNISQYSLAEDIINARNKLISFIEPRRDCNNYCARSDMNLDINKLIEVISGYPSLIDNIGWPFDYGEDWLWF